jgi:hypothetical protein
MLTGFLVVWPPGSQDRVVAGEHAAAAMQTYLNGIYMAQHRPSASGPRPSLSAQATTPAGAGSGGTGGGGGSSLARHGGRLVTESGEAPSSPFAPSRPYIAAASIPHQDHSRGEGEGQCLLAHGVLLLDIDVHGLLHSREPLAGKQKAALLGPSWHGLLAPITASLVVALAAAASCFPASLRSSLVM